MIDERLFKILGKQSFDKLETLKEKCQVSTIGILSTLPALALVHSGEVGIIIVGTGALSATATIICSEKRIEMYSKDIIEIKKIYNEIINDYGKLNKNLNLENPVEVYTLFNYALRKGYLSRNKNFTEYNKASRMKTILGVYPITGVGVCRHIAQTLKDVLKASGIESNTLNVFQRPYTKEEAKEIIVKRANEKLENINVPEKVKIEMLANYILQELEKLNPVMTKIDKSIEKCGNHVITVAVKGGKLHLLDSTQERIYKLDSNKTILTSDFEGYTGARIIKKTFFGTRNEFTNVKKQIMLPQTSEEEDNGYIKQTILLAKECDDMFQNFYDEHKDAYEEIYQKTIKF